MSRYCRIAGVAEPCAPDVEAGEAEEEEDVVTGEPDAVETGTTSEYNIAAMIVLALETATRAGSTALIRDGVCHARVGAVTGPTHGERLPRDMLSLIEADGLTLGDVDLFAVIAGPGSFTGLRVGMAAMQGLALVGGRLVVPVPTLEAMADAWRLGQPHAAPAVVVTCLDGQRHEVFFAAFHMRADAPAEQCHSLIEPRVGRPDTLRDLLQALETDDPIAIVGDGARRYAEVLTAAGRGRFEELRVPLAEVAARTAIRRPDLAVAPHALRPIYLRRPDAELSRDRARAAAGPPAVTITRASGDEDLTEVEALQRRAFTPAWGPGALAWELAHNDVARLYLMRIGGAIVAYCACWLIGEELHINSLAVDEAWRRRGLSRRLLEHVFTDAGRAGARTATLEVRQSNRAARSLYEGLGFRVEGVRREYYQEPREDALVLWNRRLAEK
jgi:ribosomal-protein-alanine N-acetyltransferase